MENNQMINGFSENNEHHSHLIHNFFNENKENLSDLADHLFDQSIGE